MSLPVFSVSFFLSLPATNDHQPQAATITTSLASKRELEVVFFVFLDRLPLPPPPSRPNASRRWCFVAFRHIHHHLLPRIQMRAGGGLFLSFSTACHHLPPPPPPSHPNASRRWCFVAFRHIHHHLLPRIQMRAGGGLFLSFSTACHHLPPPPPPSHPNTSWRWSFSPFSTACHHHHLPRIQTRAGGGVSCLFRPPATTTTSLASKCEPELMFFGHLTRFPPPPPPSHPNARWMWCLSAFGRNYPCHLPRGCPFRRFRRNAASGEI